ncbi:MAG: protease inhibitor I42 family protein [Candidatus Margulisiibacteriota bacterium]
MLLVGLLLTSTAWGAQSLKTSVGQKFTITLKSNATTGYGWQLAKPIDGKMLKLIGSKYYPQRTGLVGSGGVERWMFRALKCGKTQVSFKYVRPWEKNVPPVDTRVYQITIR